MLVWQGDMASLDDSAVGDSQGHGMAQHAIPEVKANQGR